MCVKYRDERNLYRILIGSCLGDLINGKKIKFNSMKNNVFQKQTFPSSRNHRIFCKPKFHYVFTKACHPFLNPTRRNSFHSLPYISLQSSSISSFCPLSICPQSVLLVLGFPIKPYAHGSHLPRFLRFCL